MIRIAHCCCGSLRAEAAGEPTFVGACHCTECQRRTGSPFGVGTLFPKEQVRTEGPSKVYVRGSDSGRKIEIHFCPDCGSQLTYENTHIPEEVHLYAASLADPSLIIPTRHVFVNEQLPWFEVADELPRFATTSRGGAKPVGIGPRRK